MTRPTKSANDNSSPAPTALGKGTFFKPTPMEGEVTNGPSARGLLVTLSLFRSSLPKTANYFELAQGNTGTGGAQTTPGGPAPRTLMSQKKLRILIWPCTIHLLLIVPHSSTAKELLRNCRVKGDWLKGNYSACIGTSHMSPTITLSRKPASHIPCTAPFCATHGTST